MTQLRNKAIVSSFMVTLFYVGLGTAMLFIKTGNEYIQLAQFLIILITMPAIVVSFGIMYADGQAIAAVVVAQTVMFFICWYILYRFFLQRNKYK